MSNEIDRRIVDMQFNNAQFEAGVSQSIGTLDRLKDALTLKGASSGINGIQNAVSKFTFDPITGGIATVGKSFNAMEQIAIGALRTIGGKVANLGTDLVKNLGFQQARVGWSKYEEITASVQTIMAATGMAIEDVTKYTERLNWFTDETSYNLSDMTNNIAKFTSAGIALDEATVAMIGIANASALAGQGASTASHAMQGFSKAMSAGYMSSRNWMWIQTAKMDTMAFKQELIDAAVALGVLTKTSKKNDSGDVIYKTTSSAGKKGQEVTVSDVYGSLSSKWMTKDVMTAALNSYGKFANMMGDFYELVGNGTYYTTSELLKFVDEYAKGSLDIKKISKRTGVSVEVLTEQFEALKEESIEGLSATGDLLYKNGRKAFASAQEAKTYREAVDALNDAVSTGWMKTWQLIFGNYVESKELWTNLANWMYDMFAEMGNVRNEILDEWHFSESGGYKDFVQSLYNIMDSISSVRDIFKQVFDEYLPNVSADNLIDWTNTLLSYTTGLSTYMEKVKNAFAYVAKITGRSTGEDKTVTETTLSDNRGPLESYVNQLMGYEDHEKKLAENLIKINEKSPLMKEWGAYVNNANFDSARAFINWNYDNAQGRNFALAQVDAAEEKYYQRLEQYEAKWQSTYEKEYDKLDKWQKEHPFTSPDVYWEAIGHPEYVSAHQEVTRSHRDPLTNNEDYSSIMDLYDALDGLNSILSIVKETAISAWNSLKEIFSPAKVLVDDVVKLFGALGRRLVEIGDKLVGEGKISKFFSDLSDKASGPVGKVIDFIHNFLEALTELIDPETTTGTHEFAESMKELFGGVWDGIKEFADHALPVLSSIWKVIKSIFKGLGDAISGFVGDIDWTSFPVKLKAGFDLALSGLAVKFMSSMNVFGDKLKGKSLGEMVKELFSGGLFKKEEGDGFLDKISKTFTDFTTKISESLDKALDVSALKEFALAILEIAAAFLILALIPADGLMRAAGVIAGVIAAFVGLIKLMEGFKKVDTGGGVLKKYTDAKAILSIGIAIAALAAAILIISVSLALLALIPKGMLEKALGGLVAILLSLGVVLAALFYVVEKSGISPAKMIALAVAFLAITPAILAMAVAIAVIAVSLTLLALIPADKLQSGALAIIAIMAIMGILLYALSTNALGVLAVAAAFLVLAPAVAILAISLGLLALIPADKLQSGILALTALMAVLGILLFGLSANAIGILAVAAAFLILAPAIVIMSLALIALSLVPFMKLLGGLVIFAAMLAVIAVAAGVAATMIGPLFALGGALILIGAGTILLGAGLILVSTAVTILIVGICYGIAMIIDSIANLVEAIVGPFRKVDESTTTFGEKLKEGLRNLLPTLGKVAKELWEEIANWWKNLDFKEIAQNVIDGIKNGLKSCWEGIKSAGKWLWNSLKDGFNAAGGIASPSKVMADDMKWVVAGMEVGVDKNTSAIRDIGAGMADTLFGATTDALQNYDDIAPNLTPVLDLSNVSGSAGMSFGATLTPNAVRSLASVSADISNQRDSMNDYINTAVQSALSGMKDELTFVVPLEIDGKQFAKATAKHTKDAQDTLDYYSLRRLGYA